MLKSSRAKVLVFSQEAENRSFAHGLLNQEGFEVHESSLEVDCSRLVSEIQPNLIILYFDSSPEQGEALCKTLKNSPHSASIPILQIVANPGDDEAAHAESRADALLIAPVQPAELLANSQALLRFSELEQAHRHREQQLQTIIDHSPTVIFRLDRHLRHLYINRAAEAAWGVEIKEYSGRTMAEIGLPASLRECCEVHARAVFDTGEEQQCEFTFSKPEGVKKYHCRLVPEFGIDGAVESVLGITCDIIDSKQTEQQIADINQRLSLAVSIAELGTWSFNLLTKELETSPEQAALFGYNGWKKTREPDEWRSRLHPDDLDWVEKRLRDAIAGIRDYDVEYRIVWPDNTVHWVTSKAKLVSDEDNRPVRLIGVTRDITARKQREQAFRNLLECAKNSGAEYLACLVRILAESFQVRYAFVAEVDARRPLQARTLAVWADGKPGDNFEYALEGTPCEGVLDQGISFYPAGVAKVFPKDERLARLRVEGYLGAPLRSSTGGVMGLIVTMHDKPISGHLQPLSLLQMFAGQAVVAMERERAEKALRDGEEQLRRVMEAANVGTWDWHLGDGYFRWGGRHAQLFGLPEETAGVSFAEFLTMIHADDRPAFEQATSQAINKDEEYRAEFRIIRPDGETRWMQYRGHIYRNADGNTLRVMGIAQDVTERKEAEFALQVNEERYRALVQASSQMIWSADRNGRGRGLTKWWEQMTGQKLHEARNWGWLDALHPEDREAARAAWQHSLETFSEFHTEYRIRDRLGNYHFWSVHGVPLWNADKTFREWVGTIVDITERRKDELALRESNAILTAINQGTEDLIYVKDLAGRFLLINPALAKTFANGEAEIIGKTDFELLEFQDATRVRENDLRVLRTGKTEIIEESLTLTKGLRTYLSTKSPYLDEKGNIIGLICISTDITDRKHAEKEREQLLQREQAAREEAQAANRAKDEFLAVVSHELRAPLNAMLGWTRILQSTEIDQATQKRALETIERSARVQAQIIEDLLDTARIISGKLKLEVRSMHLISVINSALEIMRPAAAAKQIEIQVNLDAASDFITGDPERLQQVVWNLLSNAIKFNRAGGRVELLLQRVDPYVQIVVRDTGKGISGDLLPFIFDRFYQADNSSKRRAGGLGLGLSLVRHLVELHGGMITAESEGEGKGAAFKVNLPVRAVRAPTATLRSPFARGAKDAESALPLEGLWILVVDDEADARDLLTVLLKRYGAEVTASASAMTALDVITKSADGRRPDVIISDIGMPEQDGYMFIRHVRRLAPQYGGQIPAIAVTAYGQPQDRIQALEAGFQSHVPKPVEADELKMVILSLTARASRKVNS